jgi:DNA adenine methylase
MTFIKWPGGKSKFLHKILLTAPVPIDRYYEPFLGGGAVFLALRRHGIESQALLIDANQQLIDLWREVRDNPVRLVDDIENLKARAAAAKSPERFYYETRTEFNRCSSPAAMIYLNTTGFNGLWRVNTAGEFNVPWGKREFVYDTDRIFQNSKLLNMAPTIITCDRRPLLCVEAEVRVRKTETHWIFADPPYEGGFTQYTPNGFSESDQARTAHRLEHLRYERGVCVSATNMDTDLIRMIYPPELWDIQQLTTRATISTGDDVREELLLSGGPLK